MIVVALARVRVPVGMIAPFVITTDELIASADEQLVQLEIESHRERYRQERVDGAVIAIGGEG